MSLRDKLVGPTEDEVLDNLKHLLLPHELLNKSSKIGLIKGVELALKNGASVHGWNDMALRNASFYGHTKIVKLLLDKGADRRVDNHYSFRMALKNGHIEIVELLKTYMK